MHKMCTPLLIRGTLLATVSNIHCFYTPQQTSLRNPGARGAANEVDIMLAKTALSVAVAALHQVQQGERGTAARKTVAGCGAALQMCDDDALSPEKGNMGSPKTKRYRRVKLRKDWRTSAWWIQL